MQPRFVSSFARDFQPGPPAKTFIIVHDPYDKVGE